jgi:hypothetical protein
VLTPCCADLTPHTPVTLLLLTPRCADLTLLPSHGCFHTAAFIDPLTLLLLLLSPPQQKPKKTCTPQRHDDRRKEIEGMMAIVAKADALDKDAVNKVFNGELLQGLGYMVSGY